MKRLFLLSTIIIGTSCSMVKTTAINSSAQIMQEGSGVVNEQGNWQLFRNSAPANLSMMEGFWYADQDNVKLLAMLIKGYAGFAYGVNETLALDDQLADKESSTSKKQAIQNYTKAYDYGIKYLKLKGIQSQTLYHRNAKDKIAKVFKEKLTEDDKIAVFYFAQAWGGLINLQRSNIALMSQLGAVKAIMDWACKNDMDFEYGSCQLFYAVYEAGRPAMLGGDLEKGRILFEQYLNSSPLNLLATVSFIQYYIIPTMDEALYAKYEEKLNKELMLWEESLNLGQRTKLNQKYLKHKEYNLFNAIAKKRMAIIRKYKKDIF